MFIEALAKTGQELVFFIHGYSVQTKSMVTSTDEMQKNFNANQPDVDQALVVPVDWACAERPWWHFRPLATYYEDQECSEKAGRAIGKFLRSLKSTNSQKLNVVAHSMGNRVLRSVGKSAAGQARWDMEALAQGKSLLEAAPKDLQSNENLFENIFFVSADIPESVFEEPTDGTESQQEEHALKSCVAALAVMSKRMHVLHANGWDQALNASSALNGGNARLGSRVPYASGESTKVWEAVSAEVEKKGGNVSDEENDKLFGNVHVQDCSEWNTDNDRAGHSYQSDPKSVAYYLEHM